MLYKYHASTIDQQVAEGTIEALSEKTAEEALYQAGYQYVLELAPKRQSSDLKQAMPSLFGVKTTDIIGFSRQLASFLGSGSSLHTALELMREQTEKSSLKKVVQGLIEKIEQGTSFSQAIQDYSKVFPYSYWQVINACEKTGELDRGLVQIADYLENQCEVRDKIRRALAYPLFVVFLSIGVIVLMATTVLPSITKLFDSFQVALPPVTVFMLAFIKFTGTYKLYIIGAILLIIAIILVLSRLTFGKALLDKLVVKSPIIGNIIVQYNLGLFCRTSAMLLKAGLPLPDILDVTIQSARGNLVIQRTFTSLKEKLLQGEGLAGPMAQNQLFPPMMVRLIAVGENTSTLENSLDTLAIYYQETTRKKIATLISIIEPALTIVIGLCIALLMFSMVIPIYKIMGAAH
jgi:type IV pilus assembly protein PilC